MGEHKTSGHLLQPGVKRYDGVQGRIAAVDFQRYLSTNPSAISGIETQGRRANPDVVLRGSRYGSVDPEYGDLKTLPRPDITGGDETIGRVKPPDDVSAGLSHYPGQLPIDPDLGVVINDHLEDGGGPGGIKAAHHLGYRDVNAIPVEADFTGAATTIQVGSGDSFPIGVVKVLKLGMGNNVVGLIRRAGWVQVFTHAVKRDVDDLGIMVAPLAADQVNTGVRVQVHDGVRQVWQNTRRPGKS